MALGQHAPQCGCCHYWILAHDQRDPMIGWFDGGAGASGDMFLGALVDAGVPLDVPAEAIDTLKLGISLSEEAVQRASLGATKVHVDVPEARTMRHLPDILPMFADLDAEVRDLASNVFQRLAEAEAAVHNVSIDQVHFHEVGALDSIADVVGTAAAIVHLGLDQVTCSTLSLGNGYGRGAHGPLPVPVPAVLALLAGDVPVQAGPAPFESTTPTGAAIMVSIVDSWSPMPPMTIVRTGMGAGTKDSVDVVNALRVVLGNPL